MGTKQRARLSNRELEYLENTIAYTLAIIQNLKALLFWVDDPDQLQIISAVMIDAQSVRKTTIAEMHRRKAQVKE